MTQPGIIETVGRVARESSADLCEQAGHAWESDGGRACPHRHEESASYCSQPVYRCARCGIWDYGEKPGPGYDDCMRECPNQMEMP